MDSKRKRTKAVASKVKRVSTCSEKTMNGLSCFPSIFKNSRFRKECGDYCVTHRKQILAKIFHMLLNSVNVTDNHGVTADFELGSMRLEANQGDQIKIFTINSEKRYDTVPEEKIGEFVDFIANGGELMCGFSIVGDVIPHEIDKIIAYWEKMEVELDASNFTMYMNGFSNRLTLNLKLKFPTI
jgi:hypothetical protein